RVFDDRCRYPLVAITCNRRAACVNERAVVLDQALERLPGKIEAVESGITALELGDDAQALGVVVEAAEAGHGRIERPLAGVAEGWMAEVVRQCQGLGQVLVEPERPRQRPRDLRHLDGVGQTRAVMIALIKQEDLRLVLEPAKRARMDDTIAIALELGAGSA